MVGKIGMDDWMKLRMFDPSVFRLCVQFVLVGILIKINVSRCSYAVIGRATAVELGEVDLKESVNWGSPEGERV